MNGWIAFAIYVGVDLISTVGLFIYRSNLKKKRIKAIVQEIDFPEWVNNDINDRFDSIVSRLNHPTNRQK